MLVSIQCRCNVTQKEQCRESNYLCLLFIRQTRSEKRGAGGPWCPNCKWDVFLFFLFPRKQATALSLSDLHLVHFTLIRRNSALHLKLAQNLRVEQKLPKKKVCNSVILNYLFDILMAVWFLDVFVAIYPGESPDIREPEKNSELSEKVTLKHAVSGSSLMLQVLVFLYIYFFFSFLATQWTWRT